MKTEVYSWRVSQEMKTHLERAARRRKVSLSAVLVMAVEEWLAKSVSDEDDDARQRRLHNAASPYLGVLASGDTRRCETAGETVRLRLRQRYGR